MAQSLSSREGFIPGYPIIARIGAVRSRGDGARWEDLGFVIEDTRRSSYLRTEDYWYAGGMGDHCVVLDRRKDISISTSRITHSTSQSKGSVWHG